MLPKTRWKHFQLHLMWKKTREIGSCPQSYGERINQKMFETPVPKNHKNPCLLPRVLYKMLPTLTVTDLTRPERWYRNMSHRKQNNGLPFRYTDCSIGILMVSYNSHITGSISYHIYPNQSGFCYCSYDVFNRDKSKNKSWMTKLPNF